MNLCVEVLQTDRIRYCFMTFYTYLPGPLHAVITLQGGRITSVFQGDMACPWSHSGGNARCCCPWFPPTAEPVLAPQTGPKATGGPPESSEVLVRSKHPFCCSRFGDGKGKILLCHLFLLFFFCSPKQPTQIFCETRRGINME